MSIPEAGCPGPWWNLHPLRLIKKAQHTKQPQMNLAGQAPEEPHLTLKLALLRGVGRAGPDNRQRSPFQP